MCTGSSSPFGSARAAGSPMSTCMSCGFGAGCVSEEPGTETLIFVDVDGVLNVGIADPGHGPMEMNTSNLNTTLTNWKIRQQLPVEFRRSVELMMEVCEHFSEDGSETFAEFTARDNTSLSDLLVWRLAQIVRGAGDRCSVILSSTWRRDPRRVGVLEAAMSECLGRPFTFDAYTAPCRENGSPEIRLNTIKEFVEERSAQVLESGDASKLRVVVLDDFHITPFGWSCSDEKMDSAQAVEQILGACVPSPLEVSVKLVHPYKEWVTAEGRTIKVGTGILRTHLLDALNFLGSRCPAEPDGLRHHRVSSLEEPGAATFAGVLSALKPLLSFLVFGDDAENVGAIGAVDGSEATEKRCLAIARSVMWPL